MQVPSSSEGGDDRPTFFELIAADKLVPTLRAALVYSVGVLVSRRPSLARLLDHEDEAFALFMLLVPTGTASQRATGPWQRACTARRGRARAAREPRGPNPRRGESPRERRETHHQGAEDRVRGAPRGVPYAAPTLDKLYARLARARGLEHATDADAVAGAILGADAGGGAREGTSEGTLASPTRRRRRGVAGDAARADARVGRFTASARPVPARVPAATVTVTVTQRRWRWGKRVFRAT